MQDALELPFPRPLSAAFVETLPSGKVPPRITLSGRHVRLEPLDPASHAEELFAASHGSAAALRIWDYLAYGPWPDGTGFAAYLRHQAAALDRVRYAVRTDRDGIACGMASYLDMHPADAWLDDANFDGAGRARTSLADTMRDRGPSRRNRHAKEEDHQ